MIDIQRLKDQLIEHEGLVEHAYRDSEGYWTIGVGRLIDERLGGGITYDEARFLLGNDIRRCMVELDKALPWWRSMNEERQRVLVDMCFNLGLTRLLTFKKALAAMQSGDWTTAAKEMLDSKWARQVGRRAHTLAQMMEG